MKPKRLSAVDIVSGEIIPMTCKQPIISSSNTHWEGIILEQHHSYIKLVKISEIYESKSIRTTIQENSC